MHACIKRALLPTLGLDAEKITVIGRAKVIYETGEQEKMWDLTFHQTFKRQATE
jgi:hypothetical protein